MSDYTQNGNDASLLKESYASWHEKRCERAKPMGYLMRMQQNPLRVTLLVGTIWYTCRVVTDAVSQLSWYRVLLCVATGILFCDFYSGLIHMLGDSLPLDISQVLRGRGLSFLAFGFQYHHAYTKDWVVQDLFFKNVLVAGLNGNILLTAPFALITPILGRPSPEFSLVYLCGAMTAFAVQFAHAAAHNRWGLRTPIGRIYRLLEGWLLISRKTHAEHHQLYVSVSVDFYLLGYSFVFLLIEAHCRIGTLPF